MSKFILKLWNISIRYQLLFGVGIVLFILIVLFSFTIIKEHSDFLQAQGVKQAKNRITMLAANSKLWVMSNDYVGLEEVINNFTIYDDLIFASIINMDGKVVAHTNHSLIGKYVSDEKSLSYLRELSSSTLRHANEMKTFARNKYFIDVVLPIHHKDDHIGWAHLRNNQKERHEIINQTIGQGILFVIVALFIGFLFSYFTANSLTGKLISLIGTIKKIRSGNRNERAVEEGVSEVNQLSHEFNQMLDTLNRNELKLENTRDELSEDIKKRVQVEKEIRHLNENLETIVDNRTKELVVLKNRAESANKSKSIFLSNMSHELRTPLNAILGFSQLMSDDPNVTILQKKNLNIISKSGSHLLSLINDVLDMSKIEADRMSLNESDIDLYKIIDDVSDMVSIKAEDKNLTFRLDLDDDLVHYIYIDDKKLRQILINIINNSIKYTDDGFVSLCIKSILDEKDNLSHITFEIKDSGRGMSEDELKNVFDPFVQVSSSHGITEGTGLGLAITQHLLKLMKADISVESKPKEGTTFRFTIPAKVASAIKVEVNPIVKKVIGIDKSSPTFKILIVEDQKDNRLLLHSLLDSVGFDVYEAVNGKEAIEKFREIHPDFIWMDMRMPVMSGYDATKEIRKLSEDVIIVAITASVFHEEKQSIMDAGCNDLVHKPYKNDEIFSAMQKYLDITFVFEEITTKESIKIGKLSQNQIDNIPNEILKTLKEALISLNPDTIIEQIEIIRKTVPDVADNILILADNYEYDTILKLIENGSKNE